MIFILLNAVCYKTCFLECIEFNFKLKRVDSRYSYKGTFKIAHTGFNLPIDK